MLGRSLAGGVAGILLGPARSRLGVGVGGSCMGPGVSIQGAEPLPDTQVRGRQRIQQGMALSPTDLGLTL